MQEGFWIPHNTFMQDPYCHSCKERHSMNGPAWKYTCEDNPYGWPYSNKCPECGARAMEGVVCIICGESQHQEACPECGTWQNHRHFEKYGGRGCVQCLPERQRRERLQREQDFLAKKKQMKRQLQLVGKDIWKDKSETNQRG